MEFGVVGVECCFGFFVVEVVLLDGEVGCDEVV